jgi:hypothetical protein
MNDMFDNPELQARDFGIAKAAASNAEILDWLRGRMIELFRVRFAANPHTAFVTADDARRAFEMGVQSKIFDRPNCMNFMGHLFRKGWRKTGNTIKSETRGSHGNELDCWRYVG